MRTGLLVVALLVAACGNGGPVGPDGSTSGPAKSIVLDQAFTLAPGGTASLPEAGTAITFVKVVSDSRCPAGVFCIWAGNAELALQVRYGGGAAQPATINTLLDPQTVAVGPYTLDLQGLAPLLTAGGTIDPTAYRATFVLHASPGGNH